MNISSKVLAVAMVVAFGLAFSSPVSAKPPGWLPEPAKACDKSTPLLKNPNCAK